MGIYIDKGNNAFREIRNSEYVDKSGLIAVVNKTLRTEQKFSCVTRSRRFGKSMAAKMLAAYYDRSCDSHSLFADLAIASDPTFEQNLNKYPVISVDMSEFVTRFKNRDIVRLMDAELRKDKSAVSAIDQIHQRNYPEKVAQHAGNLLLVGISYDAKTKHHHCKIETWAAT